MRPLRFQKPVKRHGRVYCRGKEVIRFSYASQRGEGPVPGCYLITRDLEAFFVPSGRHNLDSEFVCKVERDSEKKFDREENARRRGRWLWTPASVQRSLSRLYKILRKDWESRCTTQEIQS